MFWKTHIRFFVIASLLLWIPSSSSLANESLEQPSYQNDKVMVAQNNNRYYRQRVYRSQRNNNYYQQNQRYRQRQQTQYRQGQRQQNNGYYDRYGRYHEYRQRENNGFYDRYGRYHRDRRGNDYYQNNQRRKPQQAAQRTYQPKKKVSHKRYAEKLCETSKYDCITVKRGQSWTKLFPNEGQRDIVRRLNRMNTKLWAGIKLAVPKNLSEITKFDVAPFPTKINHTGKVILVSLPKLAWAAYNQSGEMVNWGPVSGGRGYCSDIRGPCKTIQGVFNVFYKKDKHCKSNSFPVDRGGGAPMPYCMFFHSGFALHGSYEVPGYNASHGCVRMYKEDAKWLNEEFIDLPQYAYDKGTEVIVKVTDDVNQLETVDDSELESISDTDSDTDNDDPDELDSDHEYTNDYYDDEHY